MSGRKYERLRERALEAVAAIWPTRELVGQMSTTLGILRDEVNNRFLFPVWHRECDELAFFMTEDPRHTTIKSSNSVNPENGEHYEYGSAIICYSCGRTMRPCDILLLPPERTKTILIPQVTRQ